jgi:hypothetical protein
MLDVKKDENKLYDATCAQLIPCSHENLGDRKITTLPANGQLAGVEVPDTTVNIATAAVTKLKVEGRGFIYVDRANYLASIGDCNACCENP